MTTESVGRRREGRGRGEDEDGDGSGNKPDGMYAPFEAAAAYVSRK